MRITADDVKELRRALDLTQQNLAEATRYTQAYIAAIEKGTRPVSHKFENKVINSFRLMPETIATIRETTKSYGKIKRQITGD